MSLKVVVQGKAEAILQDEARFYGVNATDVVKAIIDRIVTGGMVRDVLQGVDVLSYHDRRKGRPRVKPIVIRSKRQPSAVYEFSGRMLTVTQISRLTGLPASTVRNRAKRGLAILKEEKGNE